MTFTIPGDESIDVKVLFDFRHRTPGVYKWCEFGKSGIFYTVLAGPRLEKKTCHVGNPLKRPASAIAADGDA